VLRRLKFVDRRRRKTGARRRASPGSLNLGKKKGKEFRVQTGEDEILKRGEMYQGGTQKDLTWNARCGRDGRPREKSLEGGSRKGCGTEAAT